MQFVSIECEKQILKQRQEKRAKENCANMGKKGSVVLRCRLASVKPRALLLFKLKLTVRGN